MSAYGVCFAAIMHTVIRNNSLCDKIQQNGISFIVEEGHNNNAEIEKYFYKLRKHEMYQGIAREISFVGKDDSIAIQLADFFAFHSRRSSGLFDRFKGKLALPYSQIHSRMMDRVPHFEHIITNPYGRELTDWRGADWNR